MSERIVMNILSSPYFLFLPIFYIFLKHLTSLYWERKSLPPGPRPWPLIGNLLQIEKKFHISMLNFAKLHGPLISLRLGTQVLIVASSPTAAAEVLKIHDRLLSGRFIPKMLPFKTNVLQRRALTWNPHCSEQWRFLRSLSQTELFTVRAIESQAGLREKKLMDLMEFLIKKQGQSVNILEIVFATVFNIMYNLLFSKDFIDLENEGQAGRLKGLMWKIMELGAAPNMADYYPILEWFDPQGMKTKMSNILKELFSIWENEVKERKQRPPKKNDFFDAFLANGFDDDQINWFLRELFVAGTDTTSTTMEWGMSELLKNKRVMKNLEEELDREIKGNTIQESQVCQLPYLNATIKEILRLHPPAPFLLPHRATESCEVMSYTIPKDARVLVNAWAIGRDPSAWEDPLAFKPERFLESNCTVDMKGHDFEFLPFGSGRRICPGRPMATRQLPLILAYFIRFFHWSLPNGMDPSDLDVSEKFGITMEKQQRLLVIPTRKI